MDHGGFYTRPFETACQRTTVFPFNSYRFFVLISPWPHEANLELQLKREGETKRRTAVWCCANPGPYEVHINLSFMDIQIFIPMQMDACLCFFCCFRFTCMKIFTSSQNQHMPRYAGQEWELVFNQDSSPHTLWGAVHCRCSRSLALWSRSFALGKESVLSERNNKMEVQASTRSTRMYPYGSTRFYQVLPGSTRVHQVTKAFPKLVLKEVPLWDGSRSEVGRLRICISKPGPKTGLMNLAGSQIVSGAGKTRHHWLDDYMGDSHGTVSNR